MEQLRQPRPQASQGPLSPQLRVVLLLAGMLCGTVFFNLAGGQLFSSLFGGLGLSFLFFSPLLMGTAPTARGAQRRAMLVGGALLAYSCGAQVMLNQLALAPAAAVALDQIVGAALVVPGGLLSFAHGLWLAARP